jgi:UDP-3-O-[3-hydroxymyristoyl] glucosamine N-acyltransferase
MGYTLGQLAKQLNAKVKGDKSCLISRAATLTQADSTAICYVEQAKHVKQFSTTKAAAIVLTEELAAICPKNALIVKKPRLAFAKLLQILYPFKKPKHTLHPTAVIGEGCQIDPEAVIGANVVIGDGVKIGAGTYINANVTIYPHCEIGERTLIHAGAVIGADGFGFETDSDGSWVKVLQIGRVKVGDDVEIGANTTIDRGALDDTVIGNGVKLDNQIMIGHNTIIGDHTVIAGCTAIAGSVNIGQHCLIGGDCSIGDHVMIKDRVMLTGGAMVTKSIKTPGIYSSGTGLMSRRDWQKSVVRFRQLDTIYQRLRELEEKNRE